MLHVMAIPVATTSPAASRVHIELLRSAGTRRRFQTCQRLSASVTALAKRAIHTRYPELSEREVGLRFIELYYGPELARRVRRHLERRDR
jgi:hypothetical protein